MEIVFLLIPLSLVLLVIACFAFFWAIQKKQFDDMDTPAKQILEPDHAITSFHEINKADNGEGE